tara:strand:+ start:626 stop:973 length:348 start_codon:yes stop_codon:yes gene_type:complete
MGKRGPAPYKPTDDQRKLVRNWSGLGFQQARIARKLDIDEKTLRKHYRDELDLGADDANAAIGASLFNKAKNGDTAAAIFWAKTRMGWSEKQIHEHMGEIKQIKVEYVDTENSDS